MNQPRHMLTRLAVVSTMVLASCREAFEPEGLPSGAVAADRYLTQIHVAPTATPELWLARVTLTGGVATSRMAGFRARLVLPPSLRADGDVTDQHAALGAMMRVVRLDGDAVHATGASAEGVSMGDLFVVTVRGPASALPQLRVELEELVDVRGENRLDRATVVPRINDARIRR
jgi:hypothetical protein